MDGDTNGSAVADMGAYEYGNPPFNPVPTLTSLSPSSTPAGGAAFTLTVNGTDFVADAVVRWNGSNRTTTFISVSEVRASIPASDIAAPGTAELTVFNPAPAGGLSNALTFVITTPQVSLSAASLDFGRQRVGTPSSPQAVTLSNTGTEDITISSISITGADGSDFGRSHNCPLSPSPFGPGGVA